MVRQEIIKCNNTNYIRTYSDSGFKVVRDGVEYDEAIDPVGSGREYTESTNIRPEVDE